MDDATRASRGAAAGGGASIVSQHSARSHQSNRSIPAVIGGGNSVHQSIIGTGNYFDDTAQCSRRVVAARKIVCPKNTRGLQGSRDYSRQHAAATAALPDFFGAAKHFRTKNAEGELAYKYKDIQSEYVGNLDKLKLYRKRLEAFDMLSPSYIPELIDPHAFSVNGSWGDRMTGRVDLIKHWSQISLEHACAWQRDTFDWCCNENDNSDGLLVYKPHPLHEVWVDEAAGRRQGKEDLLRQRSRNEDLMRSQKRGTRERMGPTPVVASPVEDIVPEGDDSIQAPEGAPIPPAPDLLRCHFCWYPKGAVKWIYKPSQNRHGRWSVRILPLGV